VRCSCNHVFATTAETYAGTQLCTDEATGAAWLILILHNCPACCSTRAIIMHEDIENAEHLEPIAAE
jgi:hypothetical protein